MTPPPYRAHDLTWNRRNLAAIFALCILAGCSVVFLGLRWPVVLGQAIGIDPQRVAAATERIDPNTASVASLRRLPGIGPTMAQRIVHYRTVNSPRPFGKANDLTKVHRIGKVMVRNIGPYLSISGQDTCTSSAR